MGIITKGNDYIIDLNDYMYKVELFNSKNHIRLDSFEIMQLMIYLAIHNDINVLNTKPYYKQFKSELLDDCLIELTDMFYLQYGLGHNVDYRYSEDKLISWNLSVTGELILSIKKVISVVHEDLEDLLGE